MSSIRSFVHGEFRRLGRKDLLNTVVQKYIPQITEAEYDEYSVADRIEDAMEQIKAAYPQFFQEEEVLKMVEEIAEVQVIAIAKDSKAEKRAVNQRSLIPMIIGDRQSGKESKRRGLARKPRYKDHRRNLMVN